MNNNHESELEQALGLVFADKSLLLRALTHRSYLNEHPDFGFEDNERLEFLGDAVLDFVTGEYLYHRFPELAEGPLTSLRSALVRRDTLARFARHFDLGLHLLMGHGEAESGGRDRPAQLCAAFEAVVGAIYLDQGLDAVRCLVEPLIGPEVAQTLQRRLGKDPKSRLQELSQGQLHRTPRKSSPWRSASVGRCTVLGPGRASSRRPRWRPRRHWNGSRWRIYRIWIWFRDDSRVVLRASRTGALAVGIGHLSQELLGGPG
jgi:ribonuclease-3